MMTFKHRRWIAAVALAAAWIFDLLFWQQSPGLSIFLYVVLLIAGGLGLAWLEGVRVSVKTLFLLIPILFFAALLFMREEPFTLAVSGILLLVSMAGFALSLRSGLWIRYSLADWLAGLVRLVAMGFSAAPGIFTAKKPAAGEEPQPPSPGRTGNVARPVAFGLFLALPVVALFGWLLAMADPVFEQIVARFLESWIEYLWRVIYILVLAYLLLGIYLYSLYKSQDERLIGVDKPWFPAFLGGIEASTILASVNLLFALFVGVQFRYFFGGQNNINLDGYTYAEYARRGFGELVWVAVFSLLLFLGLSAISRREGTNLRKVFSGLGILLVLLVGVILVSSFQRLLLYESAYGFSRIRTYTHVFMIWLGVLLLATGLLELTGRLRGFALTLLLVSFGFGVSLSLLNVDGFIVQQNVNRAAGGEELDAGYLISLSTDAVPGMAQEFSRISTGPLHDQLGAALSCKSKQVSVEPPATWKSYRHSIEQAKQTLAALQPELDAYPLIADGRCFQVELEGEVYPCLVCAD